MTGAADRRSADVQRPSALRRGPRTAALPRYCTATGR